MEVIYEKNNNSFINNRNTAVGLGNFDGLHIGHMALINTLIRESKLNDWNSIVYTFTKHPENILRKKLFTTLLTTVGKKVELLSETPLTYLFFDEFDETLSRMKPEDFVRNVLVNKLGIRLAVVGFDYRFGYRGQGDTKILKEFGKTYGFKVIIIPPIKIQDEIVSSTLIRSMVAKGNMNKVFELLGRHYSITGVVQKGRSIGNKMGFPTANIHPEEYLTLPSYGVYVTKTTVENKQYESITNVGLNPTFEGVDRVSVETNIFDFNQDIYGKKIEVHFIKKIRGEKKFNDKNELAEQIRRDVLKAREIICADENN